MAWECPRCHAMNSDLLMQCTCGPAVGTSSAGTGYKLTPNDLCCCILQGKAMDTEGKICALCGKRFPAVVTYQASEA